MQFSDGQQDTMGMCKLYLQNRQLWHEAISAVFSSVIRKLDLL